MPRAGLSALCLAMLAPLAASAGPPNDTCEAATVLTTFPVQEVTSVAGALLDPGEVESACAAPTSGSVWYAVHVPAAAGTLLVATNGSDYDTVVDVYAGSCDALTPLACDDDNGGSFGLASLVSVPVAGGETLLVRVAAYDDHEPGTLALTVVVDGPANDQCPAAIEVGALPYVDEQSTIGATSDDEPAGECGPAPASVWYRFTPEEDGFVVADTVGSDFDTILTAFVGTCEVPEEVACNDDSARLQADLGVPVTAGVPVRFQVGGFEGALGTLRFRLDRAAPPANDACSAPASIATLPATEEQLVPGATRDLSPESGCGSGSASVWYEVVPPVGGILTIDTDGSDYDTVLDAFTGPCDAAIPLGCDDDDGGAVTSRIRVGVAASEPVRIAASAFEGGAGRHLVLHARLDACASDADCARPDPCATTACVDGACTLTQIAGCCRSGTDCDDGDACTTDTCTDHACTSVLPDGLELAGCRLHDDPASCGPDAMPDRLRAVLGRRLERAATFRARATESTRPGRVRRLLRRADAQLRKVARKVDRAARRGRMTPGCADALGLALAAARR